MEPVELLGRYSNPDDLWARLQRLQDLPRNRRPEVQRRVKQVQIRLAPTDVDDLVELYIAGTAVNNLATQLDISRTTVMEHVKRAGSRRRHNRVLDDVDEARRLYNRGWSLQQVGEHFGVNASTVWYTFRKLGIPRRNTQGG